MKNNENTNKMTIDDIKRLMHLYPNLTASGFQHSEDKNFNGERKALLEMVDQCNDCIEWLCLQKKTKNLRRKASSYHWKHVVERWYDARNRNVYVSNGAFITAALYLGFKAVPIEDYLPNAFLNLKQVS